MAQLNKLFRETERDSRPYQTPPSVWLILNHPALPFREDCRDGRFETNLSDGQLVSYPTEELSIGRRNGKGE